MAAWSIKGMQRHEKGQTLVETAIVLAIFLALGFGVVEFGRAWFYSNHLNNSVRAAARYGAVFDNESATIPSGTLSPAIEAKALDEITSLINVPSAERAGMVTVTYEPDRGGMVDRGDTIKVTANMQFNVLSGDIIGNFGNFMMTRSASVRRE